MSNSQGQSKAQQEFAASGFFALRTSLLPFEELLAWSEGLEAPAAGDDLSRLEPALAADRARLRERLQKAIERPEIREAVFVASPSLDERVAVWRREPESKSGRKVERAIIRYFVRMAARATPFGLFAGCSVGTIGSPTRLAIAERAKYGRHTRLDMDYICALTEALEKNPEIRKTLEFRPNSSLYRAAGRLRYAEARLDNRVRSHHLVAVEEDEYLAATLARAAEGALPGVLAQALADADPDISVEEAEEYLGELINSQLLVSELSPTVTGPEPIQRLIAKLEDNPKATDATARLKQVHTSLQAIDGDGLGLEPQRYRAIAETLEDLPAKVELPRLFQVDMVTPVTEATLAPELVAELLRGAEFLRQMVPADRQDRLVNFRTAFAERYGDREVPLVEALDEEVGIGFERSGAPTAEASPLLAGLLFPGRLDEQGLRWRVREAYLLPKLEEAFADGAEEINLTKDDFERMRSSDAPPLPDAFAVMGTVAAESETALAKGDYQVLFKALSGPTGALLLGRFCHADETLQRFVEQHLRAEEALQPDAVFAEIVHLPEGRVGNILYRPVLREHEIPFLGCSAVPGEKQIPVDDLLVSVAGPRVVLRSERLGQEVIPRLTNAHNYSLRSLGTYRFLCALQQQGIAGVLAWDWGPHESAWFLPRVSTGRLVLARARWRVDRDELKELAKKSGAARFTAVQALRAKRKLPRFIALADADNELLVDFDNILSIDTFVELVKDRPVVRLVEVFPGPDELCARGPEGRFVHEFVVPFVRTREPTPRQVPARITRPAAEERSFPPGSEWLYAKLYTGTSTADRLLRDVLGPFAREAVQTGVADRWFFIRFADPDWHLRFRLCGDPQTLHANVLPRFQEAVAPLLRQGLVSRLQFDTYEREVERYGGLEGTILAERMFHADSEAVLAIVSLLAGDEGAEARWRLALRGIDLLLADIGFDLEAKRAVMTPARTGFGREFQADTTYLKQQLNDKFRKERKSLLTLLEPEIDADDSLAPGFEALRRRSEQLVPVMTELRAAEQAELLSAPLTDLARSYMHMHVNRLLRSAQRAQELVLYHFLDRIYDSQAARIRKGQ
ncbi:MAG: lantibiotic dehydratase [Phycisphaerae bacterium]|nr:lantibiotic dehydratase [Phycisphaerae bacterium]